MQITVDDLNNLIPEPQPHKCAAKTRGGEKCSNPAGYGTTHPGTGTCKYHGGAAPTHQTKAQIEKIRHQIADMGQPTDTDPFEALLQLIRAAAGEVDYATRKIAQLQEEEAVGSPRSVKVRPLNLGKDGEDPDETVEEITYGEPQLNIWIRVRHEAMDRLAKYSKLALDAGIDQRLVRVAEQQGQIFKVLLERIFADLSLTGDPRLPGVVRKHLSAVAIDSE